MSVFLNKIKTKAELEIVHLLAFGKIHTNVETFWGKGSFIGIMAFANLSALSNFYSLHTLLFH